MRENILMMNRIIDFYSKPTQMGIYPIYNRRSVLVNQTGAGQIMPSLTGKETSSEGLYAFKKIPKKRNFKQSLI